MTAFDWSLLGPPLLAGLLVAATHVPLGRQVLARGIIFIDLAVAQFAGLGVILGDTLGIAQDGWAIQLTAFGAALAGAALLYGCERRRPEILEALIGSSFVVAASLAILLLAGDPHGGEQLKDLLVGQILWVGYSDLLWVAVLYALLLVVWIWPGARRRPMVFYGVFALAVTASVQLVGVYLVFASLILPALASRRAGRHALALGYGIGAGGYAAGLVGAAVLDVPAGALIVCLLALFAMLSGVVSVSRWRGPGQPYF